MAEQQPPTSDIQPPPKRTCTIGLRGLAGSGKSTLAHAVGSRISLPGSYVRVRSFATPIRDALSSLNIRKADHPALYRSLAQTLGAACRASNPSHFVNIHNQARRWEPLTLIDDVRYPNEAACCDLLIFIMPIGFDPPLLTPHESEDWNLEAYNYLRSQPELPSGFLENDTTTLVLPNRAGKHAQAISDLATLVFKHLTLYDPANPLLQNGAARDGDDRAGQGANPPADPHR